MAGQLALPVDCRPNGTNLRLAEPAPLVEALVVEPPEVDDDQVVEVVDPSPVEVEPAPVVVPVGVSAAVRRVTTVAVLAVALVAAAASYEHMRLLAERAGEGWRSWLLPISVDGLVVAASMSMLVRKRAGQSAGLAWVAMALGLAASLAANVAAAEPTWVGRVVAAWPPVALLLAYELLMQQTKHTSAESGSVGRQARSHADQTPVGRNDGTSR